VIRVTADTNIFVSALNYAGGKPSQLLDLARKGEINLTVSAAILDEMAEMLQRAVQLDVIKEDPDDNRILECAVASGSDYIVSGDKDLLRLGRYDSIRILTVSDFLDVMRPRAREI
jgi:predicted nucleic acid-binding protein